MEGNNAGRRYLKRFIDERDISWPQIAAGARWGSGPAAEYAIRRIPFNFVLDCEGRIAALDLRATRLDEVLGRLLGVQEND